MFHDFLATRRFDRLPKERTAADLQAELDAAVDVVMREGQGGTGSLWVPFPLPVPRPPDHRRNGQQSSTHSEHCQRPASEPTRSSSSRIPAGAFKLQSKHLCDWRESAASSILLLVRGAYRGPYRMGTAVMGVVVMGLAADIYFRGLAGHRGI
jgi:hypothetical protein